jgi:hypothetical protein
VKNAVSGCLLCFAVALGGCTTADVLQSVPERDVTAATVGTFQDIRYWADEPPGGFAKRETETIDTVHRIYGDSLRGKETPITYLCISGGGSNGAFGAGFLVGWTARGDRPKFQRGHRHQHRLDDRAAGVPRAEI